MLKVNKYFIPYIILMAFLGYKTQMFLALIFIVLHEAMHYWTALKLGFKGYDVEISPLGTRLGLKEFDEASIREDIIISIVGPLVNLILGIAFYISNQFIGSDIFFRIAQINFLLFLFNIIPALPLDGGRITRAVLSYKLTYKKATYYVVLIGILIGLAFFLSFLFALIKNIYNPGLLLLAFFFINTCYREYKARVYVVMGDLMKKKVKFNKVGFIENRTISVHYKQTMLSAISQIDKNKYTILWVLDDDMKLIDYICEEELLEAIKNYGNITLEEYYNESRELRE